MGLETGVNFIDDLVDTNPLSGDDPSEGQNHLNIIKTAVQGSLPNLGSAAVTATATELNVMDGITATTAELNINDGLTKTATELNLTKGIVLLDNPESLLTISVIGDIGTSGAWTSSSGFSSATLSTAGATGAIIRVFYRLSWTSDADVWSLFAIRKAGETDGTGAGTAIAGQRDTHATASGTSQAYIMGEGTVALDGSSDFEYSFSFDGSASLAQGGGIFLLGYYV